MSRKFHFTKDSMKRMKEYLTGKDAHGDADAKKPAPLTVAALTDVGKVRSINQDALVVSDALQLYGVADGMGGHNGGETASAGARDGLLRHLDGKAPSVEALRTAIEEANADLFRQQAGDEKLAGMGTTLSVIWMSDFSAYLGHVGDSRIYRMQDGSLQQMTDDHSLVGELVRAGYLTPEQAEHHPNKNVITRAVGTEESIEVDLAVEDRRPGDLWLICSDGLHGMVSDADMASILKENAPKEAAKKLMDAALKAGGRDNISLVILLDEEGGK